MLHYVSLYLFHLQSIVHCIRCNTSERIGKDIHSGIQYGHQGARAMKTWPYKRDKVKPHDCSKLSDVLTDISHLITTALVNNSHPQCGHHF